MPSKVTLETILNDLDFGAMSRSDVLKMLRKSGFNHHPEAALSDEQIDNLCDILLASDWFKDDGREAIEMQRATIAQVRDTPANGVHPKNDAAPPQIEIAAATIDVAEIGNAVVSSGAQGRSTVKGWVYVMSNKAMPGLVKVGYSMKDPELRARELDNTAVPHPFDVDYEVLVDDPYRLEQRAHRELSAKREGREWFRCTAEEAIATITFVTEGKRHVETFKRANREEANHMAEDRRREAELRRKEAARVAEAQKRAEDLERAIADQVAKVSTQIREECERETARQFPELEFAPYWLGWGFVFLITFYIVFDPIKHDFGTWIAAAIAGAIAAVVHINNATEKRKKSPAYLALIQKKDMAIQEAERSIRKTLPGTSPQR